MWTTEWQGFPCDLVALPEVIVSATVRPPGWFALLGSSPTPARPAIAAASTRPDASVTARARGLSVSRRQAPALILFQ